MNKLLATLAVLLFSSATYAHSTFTGSIKGTGEVCTLEVELTYFENNSDLPEDFRADIVVSLEEEEEGHDHEGDEMTFTIKPSNKAQILSGVGQNQKDLVNVLTSVGSNGLESPLSFSVKWLHGSHYHTAQCLNLVKSEHE